MAQLTATGICKHFDGVYALRDAEFALRPGEVHALIGENGAGKSTLGKILAGVLHADQGGLELDGRPFRPAHPREAQERGIAMIFQELDLFPHLTIAENMALANLAFAEGPWVRRPRLEAFCRPFLDRVGLAISPHRRVGELPMGQQQLVAIARALSMDARILVMDESTSALTDDAVSGLFRLIGTLKQSGVSVIYVSHKMDEIFEVCDRATVLRDGECVGTRNLADATIDELIAMMVGREVDRAVGSTSYRTDEVVLDIRKMCTARLHNVSLSLHRGEVLGIAGLVGSGRSELGAALFGLRRRGSGRLRMHQADFHPRRPRQAMRQGLGLVPRDRKTMGLMMQMGVEENATLCRLPGLQRLGFVRRRAERSQFDAIARQTRLKAPGPGHAVSALSGGNQQKVLLGRWLLVNPDVLFLDDPTRGVDVGAKEDIYALIESLARKGASVLMVSSELPELLRCCDRILVMNDGHGVGILDARSTTQEEIMSLAARPLVEEAAS